MGDKSYVYGENNGAEYRDVGAEYRDVGENSVENKTHWDPRIEVSAIAGTLQIGVVPPSGESTESGGIWDPADGQFLTLSREAANRLIVAIREARIAVYGSDE